jgi:hypothetical protein
MDVSCQGRRDDVIDGGGGQRVIRKLGQRNAYAGQGWHERSGPRLHFRRGLATRRGASVRPRDQRRSAHDQGQQPGDKRPHDAARRHPCAAQT